MTDDKKNGKQSKDSVDDKPAVKRGRGRPPKQKPTEDDSAQANGETKKILSEADPAPPKRGRGRPPKPKSATTKEDPIQETIEDEPAPKRGRGRPKKVKEGEDSTK
ncbi:hypothetical protein BC941DRAFT_421970 [Chlamydoabsidia padenii]|nr:hypothetical protein BC941DRAFT_421970 [Chlamydoabsidia padenii]